MAETLLALILIVVVVLVLLWLIGKLGVEAQLQMILRVAVVGIAFVIVLVRYLPPLL